MRKLLLTILVLLPIFLALSLFYLDKQYFLCPVGYKSDIIIRCDSKGDGSFRSSRSGNRLHQGLDLLAPAGAPVLAARSGIVTKTAVNKGMGCFVIIRHSQNLSTIYAHLLKIHVKENTFIRQGQVIGQVGKTGNARHPNIQPHLHFEVRKNGIPQDPLEYLQ